MRLVEAGLIILPFAFIISFFGSVSIGDSWRLVDMLRVNPQIYINFIQSLVLYLILPPIISLTFIIMGYKREKMFSKKVLFHWASVIIGVVPIAFGVLQLIWTYNSYYSNVSWLHSQGIKEIDNHLLMICGTASVAGILWLTIGAFILYIYVSQKLYPQS